MGLPVHNTIYLDVNTEHNAIVTAVQNDTLTRYLDCYIKDGATAIDLTGCTARIYARKLDGTEVYNDCVITEEANGRLEAPLTSQTLAAAQDLQVQIILYNSGSTQILSTPVFTVHVVKSLLSSSAVESSNEYGSLVVLYQDLYAALATVQELLTQMGTPGTVAQGLNLDNLFEIQDWMIQYLQDNSTAGIVETVNGIDTKIGTSGSTEETNVFGKLNAIQADAAPKINGLNVKKTSIDLTSNPTGSIFSVNGRGCLHFFRITTSNVTTVDAEIKADAETIVDINASKTGTTSNYWGIYKESAIYAYGDASNPALRVAYASDMFPVNVSSISSTGFTAGIMVTAPVYFDTSFELTGTITSSGGTIEIIYELFD